MTIKLKKTKWKSPGKNFQAISNLLERAKIASKYNRRGSKAESNQAKQTFIENQTKIKINQEFGKN